MEYLVILDTFIELNIIWRDLVLTHHYLYLHIWNISEMKKKITREIVIIADP